MKKCSVFLSYFQDGPDSERRNRTKQESAWLFRLWYSFDHKYPFENTALLQDMSCSGFFLSTCPYVALST